MGKLGLSIETDLSAHRRWAESLLKGNAGFTILGMLMTLSVVIISSLLMFDSIVNSKRTSARGDRGILGTQIIVNSAAQVQLWDFQQVKDACAPSGTWLLPNTGPHVCLKAGVLNPSLPTDPALVVGVPRNWAGDIVREGPVCVEVDYCTTIGNGAIIEVNLMGYWPQPKPGSPFVVKPFSFRKSR